MASRGVPTSVRTFAEAPAARPTEDNWPHKEKATGEEANAGQKAKEPKAKKSRHDYDDLLGPPLKRHSKGQYVYWIVQSYPKEEQIAKGAKLPSDFNHTTFRTLVVGAAEKVGVGIVETTFFLEPHGSGQLHNNLLVRAEGQWRWLKLAQYLRDQDGYGYTAHSTHCVP